MTEGLSAEQASALAPGIRLIEAGPGSGKTRTVLARFVERSPRGGIALLSFTNAAVDVARGRAATQPALSASPNFIGTFDLFLHRFVVTPYLLRTHATQARYVASWDDLAGHMSVVHPASGGVGIRLSQFIRHGAGWAVDTSALSFSQSTAWQKLHPNTRHQLSLAGSTRIKALLASHLYDTNSARDVALRVLQDSNELFLERIARRFAEVIVDEFQDCDALEHALLRELVSVGVHVVGVADPDQAIYEFRQGSSGAYVTFRSELADHEVAALSTCFRSTPAVCALVSSLRAVGTAEITSDPAHEGGAGQVHVVVGSGQKAGVAALNAMRVEGVALDRIRVVAHRRSDALGVVRAGKADPGGVSQMEALLSAVAALRMRSSGKARLGAVNRIERFVLDQFDWPASTSRATREEQLEALELSPAALRVVASELLASTDSWTSAKACRIATTQVLQDLAQGREVVLRSNLGSRLIVRAAVWNVWMSRQAMLEGTEVADIRWSHIHGVKGEEFDGVILALPSRARAGVHVLDDWEQEINSEARRVLYVGASRAKKALVLVVPPARWEQLERILKRDGVQHAVTRA
jgi:superfamily I DNA/RNA helicase